MTTGRPEPARVAIPVREPDGSGASGEATKDRLAVLLAGHDLLLLASRLLWWPAERTLFAADVHLGKAERFRRLGVPVPDGPTTDTLDRLADAVERHGARHLVVLGDLLHAEGSATPELGRRWQAWRERSAGLEVTLVRGNHDRQSGDPPPDWAVRTVAPGEVWQGLVLCHEPPPASGLPTGFALAGHVHPGVVLYGRAGDRLRLPCFVCGPHRLVLPAFGAFTGLHPMRPGPGERQVAVCDGSLLTLPG